MLAPRCSQIADITVKFDWVSDSIRIEKISKNCYSKSFNCEEGSSGVIGEKSSM